MIGIEGEGETATTNPAQPLSCTCNYGGSRFGGILVNRNNQPRLGMFPLAVALHSIHAGHHLLCGLA
jgi:hypothetical protein